MFQPILFKVFPEPSSFCDFFCFFLTWCLQIIKVVPVSKKLCLVVPGFFISFKWIGGYLSYPEVLPLCCPLLPFLDVTTVRFPSCVILLLLFASTCLIFRIWLGLVLGVGSLPTLAQQRPCVLAEGDSAVPGCVRPAMEPNPSEQG